MRQPTWLCGCAEGPWDSGQVCERIAVYGMSMESSRAGEVFAYPYHYFHGYIDSAQLRAHPHHSFQAEGTRTFPCQPSDVVASCLWLAPFLVQPSRASSRPTLLREVMRFTFIQRFLSGTAALNTHGSGVRRRPDQRIRGRGAAGDLRR